MPYKIENSSIMKSWRNAYFFDHQLFLPSAKKKPKLSIKILILFIILSTSSSSTICEASFAFETWRKQKR